MQNQPDGIALNAAEARRQYAKGLAVCERIVSVAATMLATRGFSGTSLQALGEAAGVTKNQILHHYKSKDGLAAAVVDAGQAAWRFELATPAAIYPEARESLRFILKRSAELEQGGWPHLRVLAMLAGETAGLPPALRQHVQAALAEVFDYLRGLAKALKRGGGVGQEHKPRAVAGLILSAMLGANMLYGCPDLLGEASPHNALADLIAPSETLG
jgi:TetR/AcrR family transcriptional regulator, transcriptional repressor for nem operon